MAQFKISFVVNDSEYQPGSETSNEECLRAFFVGLMASHEAMVDIVGEVSVERIGELPITLASKLASVVVHADELFSVDGRRVFDEVALLNAARDPEVQEWIKSLGALAPAKRVP
jgi:hypothetical protein